jgi:hypothetical protein
MPREKAPGKASPPSALLGTHPRVARTSASMSAVTSNGVEIRNRDSRKDSRTAQGYLGDEDDAAAASPVTLPLAGARKFLDLPVPRFSTADRRRGVFGHSWHTKKAWNSTEVYRVMIGRVMIGRLRLSSPGARCLGRISRSSAPWLAAFENGRSFR